MHPDWDRQWITICLGVLTIASAAVGAALFSAGLVDVTTSAVNPTALVSLYSRLIVSLFVTAIYLTMVRHAETAIFATDFELARYGTNRRRSVQHIYQGLFLVLFGLLALIGLNVFQDVATLLETWTMPQAGSD